MAIKNVTIFGNSGGDAQTGQPTIEGAQTGGPSTGAPRRGRKRINPAATASTTRGVAHQKRLTGLAFAQAKRSGD